MASPAVTLMHNGSSFHALPALLSDLHGALAGVANGTDPKMGAVASNGILEFVNGPLSTRLEAECCIVLRACKNP